jgi:transcriptional regulator with XRE-family HTH domain
MEKPKKPSALRMVRLRAGLSCREVAQKLGVSRQLVQFWEIGKRTPSPRHLKGFRDFCRKALA